MYQKILVPLDGSDMAECSLEEAKAIATGCHVPEVTILSVIEPSEQSAPYNWGGGADTVQPQDVATLEKDRKNMAVADEKSMTSAKSYLAKVADSLSKEGINVKTEVIKGQPADTILDYAEKNNVDLVVISSHGRSGKTKFDFGKVADKIIRSSNIPLIVASPPGCRM